jgi:hypothetical protein
VFGEELDSFAATLNKKIHQLEAEVRKERYFLFGAITLNLPSSESVQRLLL